jgi:hypothetical protein
MIEISEDIVTLIIHNVLESINGSRRYRANFPFETLKKTLVVASVSDSVQAFDRYEIGSDIGLRQSSN